MRDTIKNKDYFNLYILEEMESIDEFQEDLDAGDVREDRIIPVKGMMLEIKIGMIIAKYSRGDSLDELKEDFEGLIDLFEEAWTLSVYEDNLRFISLAYLLNVDDSIIDRSAKVLIQAETHDWLMDSFLKGELSSMDKDKLSFPKYHLLAQAMTDRNVEDLKKYLSGWYRGHSGSAWYGSHKNTKVNTYYGYWCFEAAVAVRMLKLDDEVLKGKKYYPYDLAHYE